MSLGASNSLFWVAPKPCMFRNRCDFMYDFKNSSSWIGLNKVMRFEKADDVWLSQEAETSKEQTWQLASKYSLRRSSPSRWGALLLAVALSGSSPLVAVTQKCPMWWGSDGVVLNAQCSWCKQCLNSSDNSAGAMWDQQSLRLPDAFTTNQTIENNKIYFTSWQFRWLNFA